MENRSHTLIRPLSLSSGWMVGIFYVSNISHAQHNLWPRLVCFFLFFLSSLCSTSVTPKERRGRRPSYPQQLMKYKLSARMISIYQIDYLSNLAPTSSPDPRNFFILLLPLIIIYTEIIIIITLEVGVWRGSIRTIIMNQLNSLLSSSSTLSTLTLIPMYHIYLVEL